MWVQEEEEVSKEIVDYFKEIYRVSEDVELFGVLN